MDKSLNGGDITDQVVDADEDKHMVYCDCGQETLFSVFEIVVLVSIFVGFCYMSCSACGQLKSVFV